MRCFFIGHADAEPSVMPRIKAAVRHHIAELGVTEFVVGQYGAFDMMAAAAVIEAKKEFPFVVLSILLPYHPSERRVKAPQGYDTTIYPPEMELVPRRFAIDRANRYMIKNSEFLIAYAWQPGGNATRLTAYAKRQGNIKVTELSCP